MHIFFFIYKCDEIAKGLKIFDFESDMINYKLFFFLIFYKCDDFNK